MKRLCLHVFAFVQIFPCGIVLDIHLRLLRLLNRESYQIGIIGSGDCSRTVYRTTAPVVSISKILSVEHYISIAERNTVTRIDSHVWQGEVAAVGCSIPVILIMV